MISLCACAAIGALMAAAIAAMASILFRMVNSFAMMHAGLRRHAIPTQFIARGIVPGKCDHTAAIFGIFRVRWNPLKR